MEDIKKPRQQLTAELAEARRQIAEMQIILSRNSQQEEAQQSSEKKYPGLIQTIQAAVVVHGADTRIQTCNQKALELLDLTEEQMLGKQALDPDWHFFREDGTGLPLEEYPVNRVIETRKPFWNAVIGVHRPAKNDDVWVLVSAVPVSDEKNDLAQVVVTFVDITERKRVEETLQKTNQMLQAIIDASPMALFTLDRELRVTSWGPAAERIFGWSKEEVIGQYNPIVPKEKWDEFKALVSKVLSGTGYSNSEVMRQTKDGRIIHVSVSSEPLWDANGMVVGAMGVIQDITERKLAEEAMNEKNQFIASLLRAIPVAVFYKDKEGKYLGCNDMFTEIMGVTAEQMRGKTVYELWPGELAEKYHSMDLELMRNREHQVYEFQIKAKDGQLHPVIYAKDVFLDSDGEVAGLVGAFLDITERKQSEEELSRQITLFRNLFESSPEAIAVLDHEDRVLEVNRSFETLFRYSQTEAQGRKINDLLAPEPYLADASDVTQTVIGDGRIVEKEAVRCTKEGIPLHVSLIGYPIVQNGTQTGAYAIYRDITEQKQAQEDLRKARQTLLTVLDGIDASIYVGDMHSHEILFMNRHMIDSFGADLTGRICHEAFRGESAPCSHCTNDRLLDADGHPSGVCIWETQNPITGKWYINHDRAIRWIDGKFVRLQIAADITTLKEMEQERSRMGEQLVQAQKMESIGRLAGGVAHDFNNMLSAILGHAELAMEKCQPSEPIYNDLEVIKKAAHRSADLTRQLLAFARKQTVAPRILDLNDVVAGMLKMLQRLIGEDIDFAWMPGAGLWPVKVDPSQIDQILANLCVNARDAIDGVGKITIETENVVMDELYCAVHPEFQCGQFVMLAVSDNGRGMDNEILNQIFEPFFTTKERGKGTGLGLSTVYGIVKQNDGFINVYSEPGQGSTFKVYLPRFQGDVTELIIEKGTAPMRGQGETVLLVEDEEVILKLGKVMLEKLGYKVLAAGTPSEALHAVKDHAREIQLLITDVIMPEMSGRDLAQLINGIKPGLKCIYISGYTANVIVHRGVLDEGVQFLQKPFSLNDLSVKVRGALDQK